MQKFVSRTKGATLSLAQWTTPYGHAQRRRMMQSVPVPKPRVGYGIEGGFRALPLTLHPKSISTLKWFFLVVGPGESKFKIDRPYGREYDIHVIGV